MVAMVGTYQNGYVKLEKEYVSDNPVKVIVTFLEEVPSNTEKKISLDDFSFRESQQNLGSVEASFGDSIVEERRLEL